MSISIEEVNRIAKLSRLSFNDSEKQKLQQELSSILEYVGQLKNVESKSTRAVAADPDAVNLMRDDVAQVVSDPQQFLAQAPGRQDNFVKVKSILE